MPLDATIGSPTHNSYVTVAAAEELAPLVASSARATAWVALADPAQEVLLMRAAKMLDTYLDWEGRKVLEDQPLGWPRDSVYGLDRCTYLPTNTIPGPVQEAQVLLAMNLGEGFDQTTAAGAPVDYVKLSSISISFNSSKAARSSSLLPSEVIEKLRGYGEYTGPSGMARSVKVVRA